MEKKYNGDLILLRGLPGAGKSTLGTIIAGKEPLSADDYFMVNGEYKFDPSKLKEAHEECRLKCEINMKNKVSKIVVANTFTEEWEMKPYFQLAEKYNYRVHSLVVERRHGGINVHNVPDDKIMSMGKRFQTKL